MNRFVTGLIPVLGIVILLSACSKDKEDARAGNIPAPQQLTPSAIRLINLNKAVDLMVNDTKLTDWVAPTIAGVDPMPLPTPYFPTTGKYKGSYFIPRELLNAKGEAVVKTFTLQTNIPPVKTDEFTVEDNYWQPWDYYTATTAGSGSDRFTVTRVPRPIAAPSNPEHMLVRLVNLATGTDNGKRSLAYADGSPVNSVTSGVSAAGWSDYVELPYGTYQFKVLIDGKTIQTPGKPPVLTNVSAPTDLSIGMSQVYYAPVQTYQPGGVYTIVVTNTSGYQYGEIQLPINCFSVITDVEPKINQVYGRVQVINAAVEKGIQVQIDAAAVAGVDYGKAGDYRVLNKGTHTLTVTEAGGNKITQPFAIAGGDNISLWVYSTTNNTLAVTAVPNNMGGLRTRSFNGDGSDNSLNVFNPLQFGMILQTRFLNLCPDIPFVTFTNTNGVLFQEAMFSNAAASNNLKPGQPSAEQAYPYTDLGVVTGGVVQAYQSAPGVLPGNRLIGVAPLKSADFIQMPASFFNNGNSGSEAGVYTVALIGRATNEKQPKLIVIKHNR